MAIDKITADGIADNAIGTSKIGADVIVAEDIAANAVTVAELQDNAVTTAKIADSGVTHAKLHNTMDLSGKAVTLPTGTSLANIGAGTIGGDKLATNIAITTSGNVTLTGAVKTPYIAVNNDIYTCSGTLEFDTVNNLSLIHI